MEKYILRREDTALLIIDIQERLAAVMRKKDQVIRNTKILMKAAREMDMPILVTEQYPKGLGNTVEEIQEELVNYKKFEKNSFTAYIDEVKSALKDSGRKKILITGMETHVCVLQTARDLLLDGYQVFIVNDGVCSRTDENYENGLDLMKEMGAVITNTETAVFDLLKVSGTPEFKVLSKMIK